MTNKMARNERMSPVKYIHIFQDKLWLRFLLLNEYWIICVSFAVKYISVLLWSQVHGVIKAISSDSLPLRHICWVVILSTYGKPHYK